MEIKTLKDAVKFVNEYWDKNQKSLCRLTHEYFCEKYPEYFPEDNTTTTGDYE